MNLRIGFQSINAFTSWDSPQPALALAAPSLPALETPRQERKPWAGAKGPTQTSLLADVGPLVTQNPRDAPHLAQHLVLTHDIDLSARLHRLVDS